MTEHEIPGSDNREVSEDTLTAIYHEICTSYHAIDTFRARLLGLLPLASGTGIFLLLGTGFGTGLFTQQALFLLPIGLFGVGATLALFALELRGIQKCRSLIKAGEKIEEERNLPSHFAEQPPALELFSFLRRLLSVLFLRERSRTDAERSRTDAFEGAMGIDAALAARVTYPSVLSAWLFVALVGFINIAFALGVVHEAYSAVMVIFAVTVAPLSFLILFLITGQILKKIDKSMSAENEALVRR
jgi:hypothetical protein